MASLPSGYTKLDYIQSSGTQYINTGFTPKGNSRVVMDFENMLIPADAAALFGARTDTEKNVFGMWFDTTAVQPHYGNVTYNTKPIAVASYNVRQIYDLNKGVATVGGTSVTFNQLTFNSGCNLTLLAINTNGAVDERRASGKLYSAKIYDNGTLVRDFIPCKNASGTIGLWDNVNSVFYANAGTGTFSTGTKHKTLIGGTGYEIKSGRVLIAGTGYGIKKGRTLIGGTGYDIKFDVHVGELDEGSIIKINESGSPVEFYVAKHNYESGLNGVGRTLIVRKNCCDDLVIYSEGQGNYYTGDANYKNSALRTWLNTTYYSKLDSFVQQIISTTKYPYINSQFDSSGFDENRVFTLSLSEFGYTHTSGEYAAPVEGTALPIASILRAATYKGGACEQWTRTRALQYSEVYYLKTSGDYAHTVPAYDRKKGARPVFTLPATAEVDSDFILIEF